VVAQVSGYVAAGKAQVQITVAQDGAPCVIDASILNGPIGQGEIVMPPAHGTATSRRSAVATQVFYSGSTSRRNGRVR
jgi:hypothetical protein